MKSGERSNFSGNSTLQIVHLEQFGTFRVGIKIFNTGSKEKRKS